MLELNELFFVVFYSTKSQTNIILSLSAQSKKLLKLTNGCYLCLYLYMHIFSLFSLSTKYIQDVSTRLIAPGAFVATQPEENRSPSPEPIYDQKGIRINTREYRLREKLQKQRIEIIQQLIAVDPTYQVKHTNYLKVTPSSLHLLYLSIT